MPLGILGDLLGLNSGNATIDAAGKNRSLVSQYGTDATNIIDSGANKAGGFLQQAADLYSPLAKEGQAAGTMYANSLGLNGDAGNTAALDAFHTSPGYGFAQDQGIQALERSAASRGALGGGGTEADILKFSQGLGNQAFGNWQSQLGSPNTVLGSAIPGESNQLGYLAQLATNTAGARTGVAGDVASGGISANQQQAAGQEANTAGLANLGKTLFGIGGNIAGKFMPNFGYGGF